MENEKHYQAIAAFLSTLGIPLREGTVEDGTFLPAMKIENGGIVVDKSKLKFPGDILHEAGHIAVSASEIRPTLNDNVTADDKGREGEELAAMLWSYAACLEMGMNPAIVFHPEGYKGQSDWLLESYGNATYIGLPLLVWMGMTTNPSAGAGFPKMIKWLRD